MEVQRGMQLKLPKKSEQKYLTLMTSILGIFIITTLLSMEDSYTPQASLGCQDLGRA
jgi:hypothetical protein